MPLFNHSTPVPTDEDLNYVHPAPKVLLHPNLPADKYYHLIMKEKMWRSWSGDSFGVKYFNEADPKSSSEPFEVDIKGQVLTIRDRMIVKDSKTDTPVAVILKMHLRWENTYKIYTFSPNLDNQEPSKLKHDNKDLYTWAECKDKFFSVRKTMTTVDGVDFVMDGVGKVFDLRQMRITRDGKPAAHCLEKNLGIFTGNQWEVKIGPGIDPALIVAFMAVMDEMNEENQNS